MDMPPCGIGSRRRPPRIGCRPASCCKVAAVSASSGSVFGLASTCYASAPSRSASRNRAGIASTAAIPGAACTPDLHWFFPRPRLKDGDASPDDVKADYSEAIAERMEAEGLWAPSLGTEGLYVATVRALVHQASLRPAMAKRAVFVVGDAERMVSQEGADQAANAFLKLLEEPPPGTTIILTTSEPGNLLPTIKSRVVAIRVPTLSRREIDAFLDDAVVERKMARVPRDEALARMNGAPGELFAGESMAAAFAAARRILDAALQPSTPDGTAERIKAAARQGVAGARGSFTDTLEALTHLLHARAKQMVDSGHDTDARRTASAVVLVEFAKAKAQGNVSPQLLGASLLSSLHRTLRP